VVNVNGFPVTGLRCRQISDADVDAVAALLSRGFPVHDRPFWDQAMAQLAGREPPPGLPKYGYLLASNDTAVGAILLICSTLREDGSAAVRCNLSSWYVEPSFRAYAPLLVSQALKHENVTYLNVSAAPHTRPIIEAQGFLRYSDGIFVAVPAMQELLRGPAAKVFDANQRPQVPFNPSDRDMLLQHAALGCLGLWCATSERAYPFVFRPRMVRRIVPCVQMIYCPDVDTFVRFAGPVGRALLRHGWPFVLIDANAPIPGLVGWYNRGKMPKYFKGPQRPRLGDLAYTETALFGV